MTDAPASGPRQASPWERHFQTVLTTVAIGLLAWVGVSQVTTNEITAAIKQQLIDMNRRIESVERGTSDRYTASRAASDFLRIETTLDRLDRRIRDIEKGAPK